LFYELIYETGRSSVIEVASKEEALNAMGEHHRRARMGESSLKTAENAPPAERIVKALEYDRHPNEWNPSDTLSVDELNSALPDLVNSLADENGVVPVGALAVEVRALTDPMATDKGPHDSQYRMESVGEITLEEIETAADTEQTKVDAFNAPTQLPAPPTEGDA
jgi:hypothetical protein